MGKEETSMQQTRREPTPFERFTDFTRRIIAVPKAEMEKKAKEYKKRRSKRKEKS